jgi:hypothetical protein
MDNRNIISHIKDNWIIYAFIVQLIATFVINNADHISFNNRINKLEQYREDETKVLLEMQKDLASIKTSILYIEKSLK